MRKIYILLVLATLFSTQPLFADDQMMSSDSKPCAMIAKACLDAGFARAETPNKKFWNDCMRPVLLGQTVQGATVDADNVSACRTDKIAELKALLNDLQKASEQKAN